ncbi:MAG: DNA-formamidopyrimidine glycosylase family protein, partial [Actinomycetes bacterium]
MPELPEVEVVARLLGSAVKGAVIESIAVPGVNVMKTFDPPMSALDGSTIAGIRRRGKLLLLDAESPAQGHLTLLMHLMSAGRFGLFDTRGSLRDKASRLLIRLEDGRELRLREFGTKQAAWIRLLTLTGLKEDQTLRGLGPEAWPDPPARLHEHLAEHGARPLHSVLRDQAVLAGIGRTWVDEILHAAKLSPFKRADELTPLEGEKLRTAIV